MGKHIINAIFFLIILLGLGWYIDTHLHDRVIWSIQAALYVIVAALALALGGSSILFILRFWESFLTKRAIRRQAEKEADTHIVVSDVHGVFVREMNPKATWRPLHLNPATYQNGRQAEVSPVELAAWERWQALRSHRAMAAPQVIPGQAMALPLPPGPVDLLAALDSVQRCLIVGASDSGKTTLLQWVIMRRLASSKVIVIDPHAYPGKWRGVVIGTGRNYAEIDRALTALVRLMTKRYEDIGRGAVAEMGHNRLTIIIDEWRAIAYNVKGAADCIKTLLTESRKAAFSVFVGTHSERVRALGLEGEGDLKDGFAIVRLAIVGGQRVATLDTGSGEQAATLPGPFSPFPNGKAEAPDNFALEVEPNEEERQILELFDRGQSISAIAEAVYGSKGGKQNDKVKAILERFGRVYLV
jgi:hypothetical protein